jgi:hypothetical protein
MTKKKLQNLVNKYTDAEQMIRFELNQLPNADSECRCNGEEWSVFIIDHGPHFPEVREYCTTCGGIRNP